MIMTLDMSNVVRTGLTLYHPFIGLVSWKYANPSSALYHSLSVAVIASGIAELLADDEEEVMLAAYGGLVHDFYQKGRSASPALTKEAGEKIVAQVLGSEGLEGRIVSEVLQSANYNVAENPEVWGSKHPVAALSMWLADRLASSSSAYEAYYTLLYEKEGRLTGGQRELLKKLSVEVVSLTLPQVALRSAIYGEIVDVLRREFGSGSIVPVIARGGLVLLRESTSGPVKISLGEILERLRRRERVSLYIEEICGKSKSCHERLEPLKLELGELLCDEAFEGSFFSTPGLELLASLGGCHRETEHVCMFCGHPVHDVDLHPGVVGYFLYGETKIEKWNPRLPAVSCEGKNLHELMQSAWRRYGVVACPLCAIDSYLMRWVFHEDELRAADYLVQLYFALPTHYDLAALLAYAASIVLRGDVGLPETLESAWSFAKNAGDLFEKAWSEVRPEAAEAPGIRLLDATWTTYLRIVESEEGGEVKDFAHYLPLIARAILYTGVYPVKFSGKPDPHIGDRLITPTYPLYDYSLMNASLRGHTPLVVLTLSMIDELDSEIGRLRRGRGGNRGRGERVIAVLSYVRYPFELYIDLLVRRSEGRVALEAHGRFAENPASLYG
ncbi:MAG: hypothetical protein QXI55_04400 [Thermofilum sp.]